MIELPEALNLARQMGATLIGKRIESAVRGNSPHKFAFYTRSAEEYATVLAGKMIGEAREHGSNVFVAIEPGWTLVLGGGGERIRLHPDETTLPKKHQLLLHFEDGSLLSVTVRGWGSVQLYDTQELAAHKHFGEPGVAPLSDAFTQHYLQELLAGLEADDSRSLKHLLISKPGILGVGNGYLQDILFRARLHPRRKAATLSEEEQKALYDAMVETMDRATGLGGRDTEFDLHNQRGSYTKLMDSRTAGSPCPECDTLIEKIQYLGGACYVCPVCQV